MIDIVNLPTSTESTLATRFVIPSEDRDFSRPRENFYDMKIPEDFLAADDGAKEKFYLEVQKFLQSHPLGVSYSGGVTGNLNQEMLLALQQLESLLQVKTGESFTGKIVSGNHISSRGFYEALKKISPEKPKEEAKKETKDKENAKKEISDDANIKAFQSYFSSSHFSLPKLYSGPQDGKINSELISAAQQAENLLATLSGEEKIKGQLFSIKSQKFLTSTQDLNYALELLQKNKKE